MHRAAVETHGQDEQETPRPMRLTELAFWLSEPEAEILARLCTVSPADGGPAEQALFEKLGEFLRAFRSG